MRDYAARGLSWHWRVFEAAERIWGWLILFPYR